MRKGSRVAGKGKGSLRGGAGGCVSGAWVGGVREMEMRGRWPAADSPPLPTGAGPPRLTRGRGG